MFRSTKEHVESNATYYQKRAARERKAGKFELASYHYGMARRFLWLLI
jgi:hypothetical protein